jgi:hypothetical protein
LPQPPKKGSYLLHFIFYILYLFFSLIYLIAFLGVQKHRRKELKKSIWDHHKKCGFPPPHFFPLPPSALVLLDLKQTPRFWAFRNKGEFKNATQKNTVKFPQPPKKVVTYLRRSPPFFSDGAPCPLDDLSSGIRHSGSAGCRARGVGELGLGLGSL